MGSLQTRPNMSGFQGAHLYLQGDVFLGVQSFISAAARHTHTQTMLCHSSATMK